MQILLPTHAFSDKPRSGLHTVIWNTARVLAEEGHDVFVVATYVELRDETVSSLAAKRIHLHSAGQFNMHNLNRPLSLLCFLIALRLRAKVRFDWIYVIDTSITPFHRWKLGAKLATRVLRPESDEIKELVTTGAWQYDRQRKDAEEGWEERHKPLWYRALSLVGDLVFPLFNRKTHLDGADLAFAQGRDTLAYWKDRLSCPVVYLPNGVETEPFATREPAPRKSNRFVYLFVGRLAKRRGVFELIEAFQRLRRETDDVELWLVGKGAADLTHEVEQACAADPERMIMFGEVPKEQIGPFFHACSALVDPAYFHGFSSCTLEGMYCGKPVIAPLRGGTKDAVRDGIDGFLADATDVDRLTECLRTLQADRLAAAEMGRQGAARVRAEFLWEHVIQTVILSFKQYR